MSKKLGELVVVAIKARNLSARDIIGKGDPFATFRIGDTARRTKTDRRGGQNPVWDEELRFQIMDEPRNKVIKIQVYNEDKREHVLVGDEVIKLDEVLTKGEWDAWHEIKYRNKYAGEVFLEMTFYNAGVPPPAERPTSVAPVNPNTFQPPIANKPPNSYPMSTDHNAQRPIINNNAHMSAPISYPPQTVHTHNSSPLQHNSPHLQNTTPYRPVSQPSLPYPPPSGAYPPQAPQGTSAPYPPQGTPTPYPPQGTPAPYPPQDVRYPSQPPRNGSPVSFPIPVPTPNAPAPTGVYPQYGYPPQNFNNPNLTQAQGGYPYPPNNVYPPPNNNQMYPPPNFGQGYPPTGGPY